MTPERLNQHMAMVVQLRKKQEQLRLPLPQEEKTAVEAEIAALEKALLHSAEEIEEYVDSIPDVRVRLILRMHYVHGMSWTDVARETHYSRSAARMAVKRYMKQ